MAERVRNKQKNANKHIPQRTCIACRSIAGKRGLIRIVCTASGVVVDESGKLAGRGAYVHPTRSCWQTVLEGNRISQALRTPLSAENRAVLRAFGANFPADSTADSAES